MHSILFTKSLISSKGATSYSIFSKFKDYSNQITTTVVHGFEFISKLSKALEL